MRNWSSVIIALLLVTSFVASVRYWQARSQWFSDEGASRRVRSFVATFRAEAPQVGRIDLRLLAERLARKELWQSAWHLPTTHLYPTEVVRQLSQYAETCERDLLPRTLPEGLAKAAAWQRFVCGHAALPEAFFTKPPYLHPSGQSFVALRLRHEPGPSRDWIVAHQKFAHVLETPLIVERLGGEPRLAAEQIYRLGRAAIDDLQAARPLLMAADSVWFLDSKATEHHASRVYVGYDRRAFERALARSPLALQLAGRDVPCLVSQGRYCWTRNERLAANGPSESGVLALVTMIALVLLLAGQSFRRARDWARAREHEMVVLQTLTHELRTPGTALSLALSPLRDAYDDLSPECQAAFLRICDETSRLERVIRGSTRYLKSMALPAKERFEPREIPSLVDYLEATLEPYRGQIECHLPANDGALQTDPYWLGVCITNLVDNALRHGRAPVTVTASWDERELSLTVRDAGDLAAVDLSALSRPFAKRAKGLGLGLSIVRRTVSDLGGELTLETEPTRFTITLPGGRS